MKSLLCAKVVNVMFFFFFFPFVYFMQCSIPLS